MSKSPLGPHHEVQLPQGTIRYREQGHGPPLVFVHGAFVNGDLWRKVVPLLASQFRCILPDLPLGAHVLPMPPNTDLTLPGLAQLVADFLAALDLEDVTLVGNDTGGAICQLVITNHPERLARLVLTNCDSLNNFVPPLARPLQYGAYVPGFVFALSQLLRLSVFRALLLRLAIKHALPPTQVVDGYMQPSSTSAHIRRDLGKLLRGVSSRYTLAAAAKFPQVQQPVLLAWAPEDRLLFPIGDALKLRGLFAEAQLVLIEDAWAFIPEDQPQRLAQAITAFVDIPVAVAT